MLSELFRWGMRTLGAPGPEEAIRASWLIAAIEAAAKPGQMPPGIEDAYEFRIGEEVITLRASPDGIEARQGPTESPTLPCCSTASSATSRSVKCCPV